MTNRYILNFAFCILHFALITSCRHGYKKANISGELRQWHKVTLTVDGPFANESDSSPNPFLDYRMTVIFTHESGSPSYKVPGYFAADGNAAETSSQSGNKWRAHLSPDKPGRWNYVVSILMGKNIAVNDSAVNNTPPIINTTGSFEILPTDKTGRDFRGKGRLEYVGKSYLQFTGSREFFLKAGADSPENLMAYKDFDGTYSNKISGISRADEASTTSLKSWQLHIQDWRPGDPTWQNGKGKGLIGALNYLSGKGCNSFSFLTYNAGGDGDDVWPFVSRNDKFHYDCSKLDQWQILFDHAQKLGLYLHFKLQETENDDNINGDLTNVPTSLDGGDLGTERKLYLRELIARFGYELALNWNLGEENTQSPEQQKAMAQYLHDTDPYSHHIVIHSYPDWQDRVYPPLLGEKSFLTGASLQNSWTTDHQRVVYWLRESEKAGKPWVVANDEQNPHYTGVPPDSGYEGFNGIARPEKYSGPYTIHDIRKYTLWGVLMAGGAGVEYYFGYTLPQNDLACEDWRSRDQSWDYCRIALGFFNENKIPFWEMQNTDTLVDNPENNNSKYCFSKPGELYVVYLPEGGTADLDLGSSTSTFQVQWFNPREGGDLKYGSVSKVKGPGKVSLGFATFAASDDWVILVRRLTTTPPGAQVSGISEIVIQNNLTKKLNMEQRISFITLGVENLSKSADFYENKFGWKRSELSNNEILFFRLNGILLSLYNRNKLAEDANIDAQARDLKDLH
jgi:hypothetical protein